MSLVFSVDDVNFNADWTLQTAHVCSSGGCGSNLALKWNPELAEIYGEVLADSTVMQDQFAQSLEEREYEKACFCLRSMIVHAASNFRVGMGKQISVCGPLCGKNRVRDPPWFDAHCIEKRRLFRTAVQGGQAVHVCKSAKKEYRVQMRRAKRAYTKYQKAAFLDKLFNKNPELHAMLRQPKYTQPMPLTQPAWHAYL
jgi:hypothetical protein